MSSAIVPMPVTIEQVAAVVRNMSRAERQRLLELVPDLRETPESPLSQMLPQDPSIVDKLRQELLAAFGGRPLRPEEPLLDNLTLGDYLDLPDNERARLWDRWTNSMTVSWEEVDVSNALPAG
jgi:hypothetical protein